jgi:hypothetical protein
MVPLNPVPSDSRLDVEFDQAFEQLRQFLDFEELDVKYPLAANGIYTSTLVAWMLVYQRISTDSSLEAAVKKMIEAKPAFLRAARELTVGRERGCLWRRRDGWPRA